MKFRLLEVCDRWDRSGFLPDKQPWSLVFSENPEIFARTANR